MRDEVVDALQRIYIWGFPYEFAARLRRNLTTMSDDPPDEHSATAPLNTFGHQRRLSVPSYRVGVAPNVDTLYSLAWLDLDAGPFAIEFPDFADRYYTFQVGFADTSSVAFGQRTHGGVLPRLQVRRGPSQAWEDGEDGLQIETHDRFVMIAGRILVDDADPDDVRAVHRLQDSIRLRDLARRPRPGPTATLDIGDIGDRGPEGAAFYSRLRHVMSGIAESSIPPDVWSDLATVGFVSGGLTPTDGELARGYDLGRRIVERSVSKVGTTVNGWTVNYDGAEFGDDRLLRAAVAYAQVYINPAQEALYPVVERDQNGEPLVGSNEYAIRFGAGDIPPVRFFWSLTMYHDKGFLVENDLDRFAIGNRTPGLTYEPDGSLVLTISHRAPVSCPGNWLPAPEGGFRLMLRLYGPDAEVVDGTWSPPPVVMSRASAECEQ